MHAAGLQKGLKHYSLLLVSPIIKRYMVALERSKVTQLSAYIVWENSDINIATLI